MQHVTKRKLLLISVAIFVIGFIPSVNAYTVPHTAAVGWSSAISNTQTITVASGDLLVINIQVDDGTSGGHSSVSVASVTDTQTNVFHLAVKQQFNVPPNCSAGNCFDDEIWYATTTASGSDTVTVTQTQSSGSGSNFELADVAGLPGNQLVSNATGLYNGTPSNVFTTVNALDLNSSYIAVGSVFTACRASGVFSGGTGYIVLNGVTTNIGDSEYSNASNPPPSPTNFHSGCTTNTAWIDVGAIFGIKPQLKNNVTTTSTIFVTTTVSNGNSPCNSTNSCVTNQMGAFLTILLPSLIILGLLEYFPYKMGVKDERVYIFIFMLVISAIGFLSALGAFGVNGIPFYIPIFCDIIGFMLMLTFKGNNGGSF